MLEEVNFINEELQQIFVRGIDAAHMTNALNMLQQVAGEAAEFDKWKAEQEKARAEKEKGKAEK